MEGFYSRKILMLVEALPVLGALAGCGQNDAPDDAASRAPEVARVKAAAQALEGAHVPMLDPATMNDAEIRKVIGTGRHCTFRYTSTGKPVVAFRVDQGASPMMGVVKFNGSLVALNPEPAVVPDKAARLVLVADPVRLSVQPYAQTITSAKQNADKVEAEMVFEIGQELKVGYGGYLECEAAPAAPGATQ